MALDASDLVELRTLDELMLADITDDTRICVQKGVEALKWVTVGDLRTYLKTTYDALYAPHV